MSLQQWSPEPHHDDDQAFTGAVSFARGLIQAGMDNLEARTAAYVQNQVHASAQQQAELVQAALAMARAESAQQLLNQQQQTNSALQVGMMQVSAANISNTSAATARLYDTLQAELGILRQLVQDLQASREDLRTSDSQTKAAIQLIQEDLHRIVREARVSADNIRNVEGALKRVDKTQFISDLSQHLATMERHIESTRQSKRLLRSCSGRWHPRSPNRNVSRSSSTAWPSARTGRQLTARASMQTL